MMPPVRTMNNLPMKNRGFLGTGNGGRTNKAICLSVKEVKNYTISPQRILICNKTNHPAFLYHLKHFPYTVGVGDMHPHKSTILINKAVHGTVLLFFCDPHKGNPILGQRSPHEFPAVTVRSGNYSPLLLINGLLQILQAINSNIFFYVLLLNKLRIAKYLH